MVIIIQRNQYIQCQAGTVMNRFDSILPHLPEKTRLTLSSLCILDDISTLILRFILLNKLAPHAISILINGDTKALSGLVNGKENLTILHDIEIFQNLLHNFMNLKKIYNNKLIITVFDVAYGLWVPNSSPPYILKEFKFYITNTVKKINLLTYLLISLGCCEDYGFDILDEIFFDIFCPHSIFNKYKIRKLQPELDTTTTFEDFNNKKDLDIARKFLKTHGVLYLELKTQHFITILENSNEAIDFIKEDILNQIFPPDLININDKNMIPSEIEFIKRCNHRKESLLKYDSLENLQKDYEWKDYIKELVNFCDKNIGMIILGRPHRDINPLFDYKLENINITRNISKDQNINNSKANAVTKSNEKESTILDVSKVSDEGKVMKIHVENKKKNLAKISIPLMTLNSQNKVTSKDLVDVAIVESAKTGVKKLKPKKNWTKEEEAILQKGLQDLGPSWSKILDLYGPGGTVNEILKNRTQVQLKDKARNWKLKYLKSDEPLPEYLFKVTGRINKSKNNTNL
ncbi:hypothetical protein Kpol_1072p42 [Vanderwaltozyma polyspora DSM 70294]|uniref:Uncharacterized protein n=1 Tax=Vanderwaltozyma polyspora (strain ATCC 22028 / DSM 70294 / BCRC 21397 / CBS 2163 / NBRC 10782 / NRRL Y-8283 / UCD 57-17) TaxID=436907 RepID=A7TKR0_VANPO|nr:uncharacterized protein Kpol_1072p42 [Vanderwaltozyma polyspora DSM 70294]EDO17172.1 hypothetical protein Kpol_1072p42 [Vanderwaltozyma polyspora DSM 70294]